MYNCLPLDEENIPLVLYESGAYVCSVWC